VARAPEHGWQIAAVGLTGKVFGPIGLATLLWQGVWPMATLVLCPTNDFIWWIPFTSIFTTPGRISIGRYVRGEAPRPGVRRCAGRTGEMDNGMRGANLVLMNSRMSSRFVFLRLRSIRRLLPAALLFCALGLPLMAQAPKSLLPAFGTEGAEFTTKAKDGHIVKGWLPTDWKDNTEWAPVSATYTKLADSPDKAAGAVRIKIEKVDEGGQLQLTTYGGNQKYKMGTRYVVSGWVRSADRLSVNVGTRQIGEPYEFYHEQELATGAEWKRFEFAFTPKMDFTAFLMFVVRETGTVDLAGVTVEEK